jgi:hypothetical protein
MKERAEHSQVTTSRDIKREGYSIPKESKGTIVHIYKSNEAYAVEFTKVKDNPVVTIYETDILPIKQ